MPVEKLQGIYLSFNKVNFCFIFFCVTSAFVACVSKISLFLCFPSVCKFRFAYLHLVSYSKELSF